MKIVRAGVNHMLLKDVTPGEVVKFEHHAGAVFILKTHNGSDSGSYVNVVNIETGEYETYAANTVVEPLPDAVFCPYGISR